MKDLLAKILDLCYDTSPDPKERNDLAIQVIRMIKDVAGAETAVLPRRTLILTRPLVFVDVESTGLNKDTDRIWEIAMIKHFPDGREPERFHTLINPGAPISDEVKALTGVTDEELMDAPNFDAAGMAIHAFIKGCMIAGFNARNFDVPMLYREFDRVGIEWAINPREDVIDAMGIFKDREKRNLESAVRFYLDKDHDGHRAPVDVLATVEVLAAQLNRYDDLPMEAEQLAFVGADKRIDIDGKFVRGEDGYAYFNFGKHGPPNQQRCSSHLHYLEWMHSQDFHPHTKRVIRKWLNHHI